MTASWYIHEDPMYRVMTFETANVYKLNFDPVALYLARRPNRVTRQEEEQRPLWHTPDEP